MRVMITGGTGFIGYHTAMALLQAGHRVRLLVRDKDKLRRLYGSDITDYVLGDVTDPAAVEKALAGCDAVVHTAALVSIDQKDAERVMATNVRLTFSTSIHRRGGPAMPMAAPRSPARNMCAASRPRARRFTLPTRPRSSGPATRA